MVASDYFGSEALCAEGCSSVQILERLITLSLSLLGVCDRVTFCVSPPFVSGKFQQELSHTEQRVAPVKVCIHTTM